MENKKRAYLDKIAQDNRGAAKVESGLPVDPKMLLKIVGIFFGVLFLLLGIMAIGKSLNRDTIQERDLVDQIDYRVKNLHGTIEKYRGDVKSPTLRANLVTLQGIFAKMSTDLEAVLMDGNFSGEPSAEVVAGEEEHIAEVEAKFEKARINGMLDRTVARQITLEIALILAMEDECLSRTEDENLVMVLDDSRKNLEDLYGQFEQYSGDS